MQTNGLFKIRQMSMISNYWLTTLESKISIFIFNLVWQTSKMKYELFTIVHFLESKPHAPSLFLLLGQTCKNMYPHFIPIQLMFNMGKPETN